MGRMASRLRAVGGLLSMLLGVLACSASASAYTAPSGTITEFTIPTTSSIPEGITAGPDGNLWFTENGGNKIGRITPLVTRSSPEAERD